MDEILIQDAQTYASRHTAPDRRAAGLQHSRYRFWDRRQRRNPPTATAIKVHRYKEAYSRELAVYQRPRDAGITTILGFHVPQLHRCDNELCIIEMTILTRPFLLDFAGAYLDIPPEFPENVWTEWTAEKLERFGIRWPQVQALLDTLEELDSV